jgi:hypothetical protein
MTLSFIVCVVVLLNCLYSNVVASRQFTLRDDKFFDGNGRRVQLKAGCVHYFRIPASHQLERLTKAKNMGLNTIEAYVAWNFHEPEVCFDLLRASCDGANNSLCV